jgi:putative copper resistance protein D
MDAALALVRTAQYVAGAALFGVPLFGLYAFPAAARPWPKPLAAGAAALALASAAAYLMLQTASMAGDSNAATDPAILAGVLTESAMGWAIAARLLAAATGLALALAARPGRTASAWLAVLGGVVLLSFAWTGHGAAQEGLGGLVHLAADLLHLLAAGVWIGALVAFAALLLRPVAEPEALHAALVRFSGVGSAAVAVVVASGLANGWFLVGPSRLPALFTTSYGLILTAKLVLVVGMLLLAARNRFSHTPALAAGLAHGAVAPALQRLRVSVLIETALGLGVLALVGVLGMLAPIAPD